MIEICLYGMGEKLKYRKNVGSTTMHKNRKMYKHRKDVGTKMYKEKMYKRCIRMHKDV